MKSVVNTGRVPVKLRAPVEEPSKKQFALFTRKAKNRSAGGQAIRVMAMLNRVDTKSPKIPMGRGVRHGFRSPIETGP